MAKTKESAPTAASIAARLRAAREAAPLTQVALADKLGVHQSLVSAYERGERTPGAVLLWRWAQACGCSIDELVG